MDNLIKVTNNELGTITATLASDEVSSLHLTPVPDKAPGIIVLAPGTASEEHIYYDTKDAGAGTVATLTRDIDNRNGGVGREHANGTPWETMMLAEYFNGLVDAWLKEHKQVGIHRGPFAVDYTPDAGATVEIDLDVANKHRIQMPAGNITISVVNGEPDQVFMIEIIQDSVGGRTVTWFTTIKWPDGDAPVLSSGANKKDKFGFEITDADEYDGVIISQNV